MKLPPEPVLRTTVSLGHTEDGVLCVRDSRDAWLLDFGRAGDCSALAIGNSEPVPEDATLQFITHGYTTIYDDKKAVARVSGARNEFYVTADSNIIIKVYSGYNNNAGVPIDMVTINFYVKSLD